ncbi:MAG: hypothetical protein A2284_04910 [Deltaproteobacteria bacterium RIFOXYA12_FULL_61_11]|nr:MAG: hypothetical protein A2284_04910 [Deltaproteobacteria bacterium RIFOXYA12_FULL_61_11]
MAGVLPGETEVALSRAICDGWWVNENFRTPPAPQSEMKKPQYRSPDYFFDKIDPEIAHQLNYDQKNEIRRVITMACRPPSKKLLDLRFSFWFVRRLYCVFFIGIDRRRLLRSSNQGRQRWTSNRFVASSILVLEILVLTVMTFLIFYTVKVSLGIDLFPGPHFLGLIWEMCGPQG